MSESVILCEGYHDRAFWAGWLSRLGCMDPGLKPGKSVRSAVSDPWGDPVSRGHFAFLSPAGGFIRIIPCGGRDNVKREAGVRLKNRATRSLVSLVLNVDSDLNADGTPAAPGALGLAAIAAVVRASDPAAVAVGDRFVIDGGAADVTLVRWECGDPHCSELPNQQTLERLACSALRAASPTRATVVGACLASRPDGPSPGPKEHAWSHMAGWYAEGGCEYFYRGLWDDPAIVTELENRLRPSGGWAVAEKLVSSTSPPGP